MRGIVETRNDLKSSEVDGWATHCFLRSIPVWTRYFAAAEDFEDGTVPAQHSRVTFLVDGLGRQRPTRNAHPGDRRAGPDHHPPLRWLWGIDGAPRWNTSLV